MVSDKRVTRVIEALDLFRPWVEFGSTATKCQVLLLNRNASVAFLRYDNRLFLSGVNSLRGVVAGEYNLSAYTAATALRSFKVVTAPDYNHFSKWFWTEESKLRVDSEKRTLVELVRKHPDVATAEVSKQEIKDHLRKK